MTDQDAQSIQKYMADTKRALKSMSKNDLIRAVSALLLDKHTLVNELNRLTSQTMPNGQNGANLETTKSAGGTGATLPANQRASK